METTIKVQSLTNPAPRGQSNPYDGYTEGTEVAVWKVSYDWKNPQNDEDLRGCDLSGYDLTTDDGKQTLLHDYRMDEEGYYACLQGVGEGGNGFDTDTCGPFATAQEAEDAAMEQYDAE